MDERNKGWMSSLWRMGRGCVYEWVREGSRVKDGWSGVSLCGEIRDAGIGRVRDMEWGEREKWVWHGWKGMKAGEDESEGRGREDKGRVKR